MESLLRKPGFIIIAFFSVFIGQILQNLPFFSFLKKKYLVLFASCILFSNMLSAQNPIATENALPGNPKSEWDITGAGDLSIQGFATDISIDQGQTINFKIKSPAVYTIDIYRLGWYSGNGARKVSTLNPVVFNASLPQVQPQDEYDVATGKTSCDNWSISAHWDVPADAVSGIYIAKLTRTDNNGSSHIAFVVRNDGEYSDMLFKTSDATWQAYNSYGGNSLYVNNSGTDVAGFNHATKVSYDRPFYTRNGGGGGGESEDWLFNAEYPMIRWLERNGYDVSYTTDVDMDRDATNITTSMHKVLLAVGHDEYWSADEREKFENARNNGVHLAFLSGNEVYWKTRWEDNHRTLVCYKEGTLGENVCGFKCDTSTNTWTGLWRDGNPATYTGSDGGNPENSLTGQISWDGTTTAIEVPDTYKNLRFWRNTDVANLTAGQSIIFPDGTLGYEWDWEQPAYLSNYPKGRITLSNTDYNGHVHKLSLYRHQSGALVFGAGTVQWSWGLDDVHDRGNEAPSLAMQQATVNLFADMGVQPYSPHSGLVSATASTDNSAAVSTISSPIDNDSFPTGIPVNISGTATDVDGVVAGVEVSIDGGTTWNVASGSTSWTYSWTPTNQGATTIMSRAFDDSGNMEIAGTAPAANAINVTVTAGATPVCPCTIFSPSTTPSIENDAAAVELGVKFKSSEDGYVTGIRFYKGAANTGIHTGYLWSNTDTTAPLATIIFTNETASGWQEATFGTPVAITANTTYVASYHTNTGYYAVSGGFFDVNGTVNPPLTALQSGIDGTNGVYRYGSGGVYPTDSFNNTNYWVDVVFNNSIGPDIAPPVVVAVAPANNAIGIAITTHPKATFNESLDVLTVDSNSVHMTGPGNSSITGSVGYNAGVITFTPSSSLAYETTYTLTLNGGYSTHKIKDIAGNGLTSDYSWSFTTIADPGPPPIPPTEGPGGPILVISSAANPFSRYPVEILRAEGLNAFSAMDISTVNATTLTNYDVIILGEMPLNASNVTMLTDWVNAGGALIAFKPNALLSPLLGITSASETLSDQYLLFKTDSGPGLGLVNQTIQFHGTADFYTLNENAATSLATLYSNATTATTYPAVTTNNVGANGGKAIAFTYDLAKSIVYTRQGNPDWVGQERDGQTDNIRSSDMFYPDWIDLNKVAIPQADEQQHLLSNIILQSNLHRKPLPKFWFLPRKLKAAIVMTGDDHASGGTIARFNQYYGYGNNTAADILDWKAVRGTSYIYTSTPISDAQAADFNEKGFEIALHLNTDCNTYDLASLGGYFDSQLPAFMSKYSSIPAPSTHRTHCISWSDWASKPKVELANGIRLNTDYYYWPAAWIQNRPGMFTGSGMPMRYADLDGTIIDNYQVTTQMPDESGISFPGFIDTLLDNAIGTPGYYGVFCANMHTDADISAGSDAIIASAQARNVPVVSAKQMLTWLDGRNNSSFGTINWSGNNLNFSVTAATGAHKLQGMVPVTSAVGELTEISYNGSPVSYTTEVIKGINYAFFDANTGNYSASYLIDATAPVITNIVSTPNSDGTAVITWTTNEVSNSTVNYGTTADNLAQNATDGILVTNHSITLTGLNSGITYYYNVTSSDASSNSSTEPVSPTTLSFAMPTASCATDATAADFILGTTDANTIVITDNDGSVSLKPALNEEFSGTSTPSGWTDAIWDAQAGAVTTFSGGQLTVNGTHLSYNTPFAPSASLEFVATFTAGNFQNIGFTGDADFNNPWVVIGRGGAGDGNVYARTSDNQTVSLGSTLLNMPHKYRIQWLTNGAFEFYVDDVLIATPGITQTVNSSLILQISDYPSGGVGLSVDWIRSSPYPSSGTFTSRVFDAGETKNWENASWSEDLPVGTALQLSQRQSDSSATILTEPWTAIASNGDNIGGTSQYIQYKVDFTSSNSALTPVLKDFAISCSTISNASPVVTTQPISQSKCIGENVSFISAASGNPAPTVQWQVSLDNGISWSDIELATNPTYTFATNSADNGNQFKAIWTNNEGNVTSEIATLTVNPLPTATINAVTNTICLGGTIELQLSNATGASPYTLVVNGTTYSNVINNQTFATIDTSEKSIWGNTGSPANPSVTDNQPIEIGTKFRSTLSGFITGIRFYKGLTNTGAHTANLWTTGGTLLASAVFTAETASGWQEVRFTTPVAIQANTTYIASYLSQNGYFAISTGFFTSAGVTNGPLTALQAGTDGVNGVYKYGGGFPDGGNTANYWVDVLFSQVNANTSAYELTSITDANGCENTGTPLSSVTVSTSPAPAGSISPSQTTVCEGENIDLTFNATAGNGPFSLEINGTTYPGVTSGIPFSTGVATYSPAPVSIWTTGTIGGSQTADNAPTELGVKIKSSVPGTITGIRFYKPGTDLLNFTGSLWAVGNTTTPLATANYTSDNTAGWKEIIFSTPVTITANTSYIASYFSPGPNYYAFTANGLSTPIVNVPLTAEASYYKQPGTGYPDNNSAANYWVDVIFNGNSSTSNFSLTSITSATGCSTLDNPISNASVSVNSPPTPILTTSAGIKDCVNTDITYTTQSGQSNYEWTVTGILGTNYTITSGGLGLNDNTVTIKWISTGVKTVNVNYSNAAGCLGNSASAIATITSNTWTAGAGTSSWTEAGNWSCGIPDSESNVVIDSSIIQPIISSNVTINSLTIESGSSLTVSSTYNLTITDVITNSGTLTIENNANLIQTNNVSNTGAGNTFVNRDSSPLFRLDYTIWSSPVSGNQVLGGTNGFSPLTSTTPNSRFYTYNTETDLYNAITDPSTTTFELAKGYLIRMPNTWVDYVASPPSIPLPWTGTFSGTPNNGNLAFAMSIAGNGYNAVGNPYPSTLNIDSFINANILPTANNIDGTLYFWRKRNDAVNTTTYSTCTSAGCSLNNGHTYLDDDFIAVGQGFIVKATSTTLNFTNSMRGANNTNQFFKTKAVEKNRIWLNLYNDANPVNQMMVAYMTGATQAIDPAIDGRYINDSQTALNSLIDNEEFVIQGRSLPFTPTDVVPLAFKTIVDGNFSIAIDHVDGLFSGNQDIFLKDNTTGTETDLKLGAYAFTATAGVDNSRFELRYQKTLETSIPVFNENSITVFKNNGIIHIKSEATVIDNVKLFDIRGRLLLQKTKINATATAIESIKYGNQILIIEITSEENKVVSKKIVN